jgi:hypothetical protein
MEIFVTDFPFNSGEAVKQLKSCPQPLKPYQRVLAVQNMDMAVVLGRHGRSEVDLAHPYGNYSRILTD